MRKYIAEFIGTFVLVAFGCGSAVAANSIFISMGSPLPIAFTTLLIAFAFGLSIVAMAYSIGNISGCHVNPAVSLGMLIAGRMNGKDFIGYLVGQFLGAVAAALFLMVLFGGRDALGANGYGQSSAVGISMMGAVGLEIVLTFVFVLVVLGVTSRKEYASAAGLVIGLSLTLVHILGIPFTGTSVNPARSFGPAVLSGGDALTQLPVFIIAPLIGGALAAVVFRFLFKEDAGATEGPSIFDSLTKKFGAGAVAAEELLEEAGDEFEETFEAMRSEEEPAEESFVEEEDLAGEEEEPAELLAKEDDAPEEIASEEEETIESGEEPVEEDSVSVGDAEGNEFDETYELMKENRKHNKSGKKSEQTEPEKEEISAEPEAPAEEETPAEEAEEVAETEKPEETAKDDTAGKKQPASHQSKKRKKKNPKHQK